MDSTINHITVTVLMPVFNGEKYLKQAIESILNQDYKDFEFMIINDGSLDNSLRIIESYSDNRIVVINNERNIGLINSLNKGLDMIHSDYIVRMDCDDICEINRISEQVKFMESNPNIGACGSYYYQQRGDKKVIFTEPINSQEINAFMIFNSPIAHPTAIIRNKILKEHHLYYSINHIHAEDYKLWIDISNHSLLANIALPLLIYRVHENQITGNKILLSSKKETLDNIRLSQLNRIGIFPSVEELQIHHLIFNGEKPESIQQLNDSMIWLNKLVKHLKLNQSSNLEYFNKIIIERWLRLCVNFYGVKKGFFYFFKSSINKSIQLKTKHKIDLIKSFYYSYKRSPFY